MASKVKAASQPNTTTAHATPRPSVRPRPWTRAAPQVTTSAAATRTARGRDPSSNGPITASSAGTQATATPRTAGSACRDPATSATLNSTSPVAAMPVSHSHSVPRGMTSRRPVSRARTSRIRHAAVYRRASAVNTGACASTPDTATLPPTQIMAPVPVAMPAAGAAAVAAAVVGAAAAGAEPLGRSGAGMTPTLGVRWSSEQDQ